MEIIQVTRENMLRKLLINQLMLKKKERKNKLSTVQVPNVSEGKNCTPNLAKLWYNAPDLPSTLQQTALYSAH